ncbi:hypothetical protein B566_EDAN008236 [Ephemera danica]|nr:hypothetical protein B566_EDAN008236 [Ephemera danica]
MQYHRVHVLLQVLLGVVGVSVTLVLALLAKVYHDHGYWKRRGMPTIPSTTPLLGNFGEVMNKSKAFTYVDFHTTTKKMDCKFAGIYIFTRPSLWLVDLDIIRDVTVRHFDHFSDRKPTAFGTVSDALHNEHDDFYNYGITLMDMSGKRAFVMMGYFLSPWLMQKLGIPFVPQALTDFFLRTINTTIKYRQSENVSRTDMIQLLLDARQNQKVDISDVDIVAHAFTFFLAGFDTIAATLSFTMQLLAMHPEIQAKLRVEVDEAFERGQGKLGYELVHSLNYMEMVGFSIYGLHHDPEYFPDPERFDPERFNEENKSKLKSFTYMPFGSGPRNCIGIRFAQLEVKLALAYVIAAVELEVCERTTIPLVISAENSQMKPTGGFWLTARPRTNKPSVWTKNVSRHLFAKVHVLLQVLLGVVGVSVTLVLALLAKVYHDRGYWKHRGVPIIPAAIPLLGNFGELMTKRKAFPYIVQASFIEGQEDFHTTTKKMGCKFAGIYMFTRPSLWLVDLDIIRDVTVRHFDHFSDRRPFADKSADELLGRSLLSLQGDEWRDMRHTLSPAFNGAPDGEHTMRRFAADVIASTAFGTVSDALHNEHDDFYNYGIKLMDMSGKRAFIFMGYLLSPWLMQKLGIPFVPHELSNFFTRSIHTTIKYRENELILYRIRFVLFAAEISDVDIVAQAFTFFLGGFDTIAAALSFCVQLLAMHPEVQAKLRDEVDEAFERGHGQLGYELMHSLSYMDMVINEVMRLYPAAPMVDRMCTKSFELPEHGLHVEKGTPVGFSIYGLHHDPEYFPDPERFDPERCDYNVLGIRFAQLEMKLALAYVIAAVELEVCERTTIPLVISAENSQMKPTGGFWVTSRPRTNKPWVHAES